MGSHCNATKGCSLDISSQNFSELCDFIRTHFDVCEGGGYIAYTETVFCNHSSSVTSWLVLAAFLFLLLEFFLALSVAADGFFCPSLAVIVDHLKISQNIAVSGSFNMKMVKTSRGVPADKSYYTKIS